jgi:hypothetical protein
LCRICSSESGKTPHPLGLAQFGTKGYVDRRACLWEREFSLTIYQTLLTRGYFPKELPPAFFTEQFARYATTKVGRSTLMKYKPLDNFTECCKFQLALPGLDRRELRIPHPFSYSNLAQLTSKNFSRLLRAASRSGFSKSRPVYATGRNRAIQPMTRPAHLARERAASRAGSRFLLRADVSQFYPSLYTHAVGWALDPKLRKRVNWQNKALLGKNVDQLLMDQDGKLSQGIPIGNDISFLLAEVVLAQVDKELGVAAGRAYRWFDDYELAFDTRAEAEATLTKLSLELSRFQLRLNPRKTTVLPLPQLAADDWQAKLSEATKRGLDSPDEMLSFFDVAFGIRGRSPDSPVLTSALGKLFSVRRPTETLGKLAQSCITQVLLTEPGAAQRAFSLLTFWKLNGLSLDLELLKRTIVRMVLSHEASGFSSDIAWALAFCLQQRISLTNDAAQVLSEFGDDCTTLQALHMRSEGLLSSGFTIRRINAKLKIADLDRDHWFIAYESVRQGFSLASESTVKSNSLFSELLARGVTFYRPTLPAYALVVHPGGAPEGILHRLADRLRKPSEAIGRDNSIEQTPVFQLMREHFGKVGTRESDDEVIAALLDVFEAEAFPAEVGDAYSV